MTLWKTFFSFASFTVLGTFVADSAEAAIIKSVDFAGGGPNVPSLFFDLGNGLELTVTAGTHSGGSGANAPLNITGSADITQTGGNQPGIGVNSGGSFDSSQLDAAGPNEFLRFAFNREVTLLSTVFESASNAGAGTDEFDVGIDGIDLQINSTFGTDTLRSFPGAGFPGGTDREVDFSGGVDFADDGTDALFPAKGSVFDFYTDDSNDDYRIRSLTVKAVPEPLTILGTVTALGMGVVAKRRASSSAQA